MKVSFVPNYKINRIAPAHMDMKDMNKLKTSLREVLLYIKYSKDKEKLKQVVLSDERFKHVERSAVSVINVITNSKIKFEEKGEEINMCQAIMEMREEERLIGREEGREEGRKEGREEGREETAKRMLKLGKNTLEEISICCNLDIERIKELQNEN
jgi:predicted transposase YdaD